MKNFTQQLDQGQRDTELQKASSSISDSQGLKIFHGHGAIGIEMAVLIAT